MNQQPNFRDYLKRRDEMIAIENQKQQAKCHLYDEKSFYAAFLDDLKSAEKEVVIYSPFIGKYRLEYFRNIFKELTNKNIPVFIFTRPIEEHEAYVREEIRRTLNIYGEIGVNIFYLKGAIHEKLSIIDRKILWEGSLNILSQRKSREMMRRIHNEDNVKEVLSHLKIHKMLTSNYKEKYQKMPADLEYVSKRDYVQIFLIIGGIFGNFFSFILLVTRSAVIVLFKIIRLVAGVIKFIL